MGSFVRVLLEAPLLQRSQRSDARAEHRSLNYRGSSVPCVQRSIMRLRQESTLAARVWRPAGGFL
jgi:hypothetical protein